MAHDFPDHGDHGAAKSKNVVRLDKSAVVWRATFDVVLVRFA